MSSAGQALGGVAGAVIGFIVGGGPQGALYGAQIGMSVGGLLDPPKGPKIEGPRLNDLSVQTATYGAVIPRVYGTVALNGNIFWLENNKLKEVARKSKSGGKGGGKKATTTTYSYYATFAVGLCQTQLAGVRRIWMGSKLIYDAGSVGLEAVIASNRNSALFTLHLGSDTQLPDARMQATLGVANTPAYRGLAYLVFNDYPLAEHGNSLLGAPVKVEVVTLTVDPSFVLTANQTDIPIAYGGVPGVEFSSDGERYTVGTISSPSNFSDLRTYSLGSAVDYAYVRNQVSGETMAFVYASEDVGALVYRAGSNTSLYATSSLLFREFTVAELIPSPRMIKRRGDHYYLLTKNPANTHDCIYQLDPDAPRAIVGSAVVADASAYMSVGGDLMFSFRLAAGSGTSGTIYVDIYDEALSIVKSLTIPYAGEPFALSVGGWSNPVGASFGDKCYWLSGTTFAMRLVEIDTSGSGSCKTYALPAVGGGSTNIRAMKMLGPNLLQISSTAPVVGFAGVATLWLPQAGAAPQLSSIVESELLASNLLTSGDIDASALTQSVRGYRVGTVAAIRSAIEPLQAAWPFDVVQSGYQIVFRPRGGASVATIPATDLDARGAGDSPGVAITNAREMDSILPWRVNLSHLDVGREYDPGEQYAERLNTASVNIQSIELAIVMTSGEAAATAETLLYVYWLERYDLAFKLPPTYNHLEPADVIAVEASEATYLLRLTAITYTQDGRLECTAKYAGAAIYTPAALGEDGQSTGNTLSLAGATLCELLDIPLLVDATDAPGFVVAMTGYLAGWPGGILFRTDDGGQTWVDLQGASPPGAVIGYAGNAIGAGRTDLIDKASALSVQLSSGELSSVTELSMLGGANHFAYGADGRWEIIGAQNCVLQGDGSYVLTDLLRGRQGSEWACALHVKGDVLVLLDSADLAFISANLDGIGMARTYRAITDGKDIESATDRSFAYTGVNLECLAPVYLNGNRHPSTNDWSLEWIRRTRVGGAWRDYVDATLGEATESYEVDIFSNNTYATLKRTLSGLATPTAAYTSAQQVTDFGGNQSTLYVKVYQVSSDVGRGYPLTTSITR